MTTSKPKIPSIGLSLVPIITLIAILILNVVLFKDDATGGPNQLALLFVGMMTMGIGRLYLKMPYKQIEDKVVDSISLALQASLILLVVGALIGTWILSGIVPTMIYYGLQIINPSFFLPVACVACCIVSISTGSSWSTTGTIGIALIGIGNTLGIPEGMVAGAIISGAYFGDKMSPLSDTTNLAPAMAGTDLFSHIRHMVFTSGPAILMALVGFSVLGFFYGGNNANPSDIQNTLTLLDKNFNISLFLFLVPVGVIVMVAKKIPALPALIIGTFLGAIFALIFQSELIASMSDGVLNMKTAYMRIIEVSHSGFSIESGDKLIDKLLSRGGMSGMLSTVWLILMAMVFGGALEGTGMLNVLANAVLRLVKGAGSLVGATLASCFLLNLTASDQYLAIVVPGRMFRKAYEDFGLDPKNLSRALEDAGTVTSVLIPWNTGGAYNSGVLGVATLSYAPYCFFNILSPLVSLFLASMGWTIDKIQKEKAEGMSSPGFS
ncbi:MAG: Na+/H+ antiporter NhaC [Bacteriovoracaceae bacterium]|nr:Na+/H+ antiporter NhaC [Bacteriovoracaceae bacterium]